MKYLSLILFIYTLLLQSSCSQGNMVEMKPTDPSQTLWYDEPAKVWTEALPVGNGRLGAMIYGGT
ncbi:MAG: glycoside hydrolase N-terminal domain-containing protein, partial [Flavobacteriales bacterium]